MDKEQEVRSAIDGMGMSCRVMVQSLMMHPDRQYTTKNLARDAISVGTIWGGPKSGVKIEDELIIGFKNGECEPEYGSFCICHLLESWYEVPNVRSWKLAEDNMTEVKSLEVVRVPYGSADTPEKSREYKVAGELGPVGTKEEWAKFAKQKGFQILTIEEKDGSKFSFPITI